MPPPLRTHWFRVLESFHEFSSEYSQIADLPIHVKTLTQPAARFPFSWLTIFQWLCSDRCYLWTSICFTPCVVATRSKVRLLCQYCSFNSPTSGWVTWGSCPWRRWRLEQCWSLITIEFYQYCSVASVIGKAIFMTPKLHFEQSDSAHRTSWNWSTAPACRYTSAWDCRQRPCPCTSHPTIA